MAVPRTGRSWATLGAKLWRGVTHPGARRSAATDTQSWWPVWTSLLLLVAFSVMLVPVVNQHLPDDVVALARRLGRVGMIWVYVVVAGVAALVYYLPRRGQNRPFFLSAGAVGATLASLMGLLTYWPCTTSETPFWSAVYHTMALFVGSTHDPFDQAGAVCSTMPVALEVARILALGVALSALVAVLLRLFVEQVDRLRVRFARQIVLVTGLADDTQDFVLQLVRQYDGRPAREALADHPDPTMRDMAARLLGDEVRESARVVFLEPYRGHPLSARMRQAGVLVVTASSQGFGDLGLVNLGTRLRAAYLLDADSSHNIGAAATLQSILARADSEPTNQQQTGLVPVRIMVRVDDSRDAEEYRRKAMSQPTRSVVVDAFGQQQVTCQEIATRVSQAMADLIVVIGATSLATTLLDELAQAAREFSAAGGDGMFPAVVIVDPQAFSLLREHRHRQAWYGNSSLAVRAVAAPSDETNVVRAVGGRGRRPGARGCPPVRRPFIVDCRPPTGDTALLAHRCIQIWPYGTVLRPDPTASGIERDTGVPGLHRFAPSLLSAGDIPADRWMRAARIMHLRYLADYGTGEQPAGRRPWELLSIFYRMSNLRALTHAMHLVGEFTPRRVWYPTYPGQAPKDLSNKDFEDWRKEAHEDWRAYYESGGWAYAPERDDAAKRHDLLRAFEDLDRAIPEPEQGKPDAKSPYQKASDRSQGTLRDAFDLLRILGYRPYEAPEETEGGEHRGPATIQQLRASVWARTPARDEGGVPMTVSFTKLEEDLEWHTTNNHKMIGRKGDYRPTEGDVRTVKKESVHRTYIELEKGTYQRHGMVTARRADPGEVVHTDEGSGPASEDQWLVRDEYGKEWLIPDEEFWVKHEPYPPSPDPGQGSV